MAPKSLFPAVQPLPGKKMDYSHVPRRVDCRRVVTKRANISASPTVTRPTAVTIASRIPVRIPATLVPQKKPTIALNNCLTDVRLFDGFKLVLDPIEQDELEEFELLEFELLESTILQEELDEQSPPVLPPVQSYRPVKRKQYARGRLQKYLRMCITDDPRNRVT